MKNILLFLAITSTVLFSSCEGPEGPPGDPGINILGQVFETNVNFSANNNFSQIVTFPSNVEVFESDVILVYLLESVTSNGDDVWSQLPQTFFPPQGTLLYSFDHTFFDVRLFLDSNFDLNTLGSEFTNNQIFRIAVVPSEYANANLTMDELLQGLEINPTEIKTISE
tara:strand:+ start:28198 stop:28701 length:504 start_codon:yes stop_codon:yes gene_type:complete